MMLVLWEKGPKSIDKLILNINSGSIKVFLVLEGVKEESLEEALVLIEIGR